MIPLTLQDIAVATGGVVRAADRDVLVVGAASVDSRDVERGGLFVAVMGERVDGHDFALGAVRSGAAAVLASREIPEPCVVVDDPVAALGRLAAYVRDRLVGCTVVALTGSQGKTSAKDLVAQLLEHAGPTVSTLGNLNNELGVPLTVLRADADTRYLVVEMGARHLGNIAYLCSVARPDIGVVLNVGTAHLGEFGSRENIAVTKGELVESLPRTGTAVLNADDPRVLAMASRTRADVQTFGVGEGVTLRITDLRLVAGEPHLSLTAFDGSRVEVHVPLLGAHQAHNAAAAALVARAGGMGLHEVADALSTVHTRSAWRMERRTRDDGMVVVNDAYNANPESMAAALRTLAALARRPSRRTIAVLGEMRELGDDADAAHEAVGALVVELGIDLLLVVGAGAAAMERGAVAAGGRAVRVDGVESALDWLTAQLVPGDVVLVKASRAAGLERVADALLEPTGDTARDVLSPDETDLDVVDLDEGKPAR